MNPLFTVVVPTYNGGDYLSILTDELSPFLAEKNGTLLFVNDGSTDDTQAVIRALSARHTRVAGITLDKNRGQQSALLAGIHRSNTPWIITMDDDGSHPARVIPLLLKKAAEGFDLVYAQNISTSNTRIRSFASRLHHLHFRLFLRCPRGIHVGSFRILSADHALQILGEPSRFCYLSAKSFLYNPATALIQYRYERKSTKRSHYNLRNLIRLSWNLFYCYGPMHRLTSGLYRKDQPLDPSSWIVMDEKVHEAV